MGWIALITRAAKALGLFAAGLLTVLVALVAPYLGIAVAESAFAITINGFVKALIMVAAAFAIITSLEARD